MKPNYKSYNFVESIGRMKEIIKAADTNYDEKDYIPSSDSLTFTNGYYVNCSVIACDIRDSSSLPEKYQRPSLAKIYRSFISEMVALLNSDSNCKEICIEGDCVWAIYDTPKKADIDSLFSLTAECQSLIKFLNYYLSNNNIEEIKVGIGLSYGRSLLIKAGYKGSTINDLVWLGKVVNEAHKLCGLGSKNYSDPIFVSNVIEHNLKDENKKHLKKNYSEDCYHCNVVNSKMSEYYKTNMEE